MLQLPIELKKLFSKFSCFTAMLLIGNLSSLSALETSIYPDTSPIKIGISTNEGHEDKTTSGLKIKEGIEIYFARVNAEGGIGGRQLQLIARDDEYEPERAAENVRALIDNDQVLALLANGGTPTNLVTLPIINEKKTLIFSPFTGADFLYRSPPDRYVFTFRASYTDEVNAIIKGLLSTGIKPDELAFFVQKDAFGDSVYNAAMTSLRESGYTEPEKLPIGQFTRNSENVENGLASILLASNKNPKAILIASQQMVAISFIKLAIKEFPDALFVVTSAARDIEEIPEPKEADIIIAQLTPYFDSKVPALAEYLEDLKKYAPNSKPSQFSWSSYLAAKLFVKGLKVASSENRVNREGIVDALETLHNIDLGIGVPVGFDKNDHAGLEKVWFTRRKNGVYETFKWEDLKK